MTPDEHQALVQFFGTMHAEARQNDQKIVGNSQFVKPVSPDIQHQLEEALRIPVQLNVPDHNIHQNFHQPEPQPPIEVPVPYVIPEQVNTPPQYVPPVNKAEVLIDNKETVKVLKEISLNLARIASTLETKYGISKRTKPSKPA